MRNILDHRFFRYGWILLLVIIGAFSVVPLQTPVFGQDAQNDWQPPADISKSGGSIDPHVFIDEHGVVHAVWLDTRTGYYYSRVDGNQWTAPVAVKFPFTQPLKSYEEKYHPIYPIIFSTPDAYVHALWRDERGRLEYSYSLTGSMGNRNSWMDAIGIMDSVAGFDAAKDPGGNVYLAFIKGVTPDLNVPGIYYTRRGVGGYWSTPKLLFDSEYFRTITPDQANIRVAVRNVNGVAQIFIVWDIRALNRIYLMRSIKGGQSWEPPIIVDGPEVNSGPVMPKGVRVGADAKDVIVVWQAAQPGQGCAQYFQVSRDSGASWETRKKILTDLQDCPEENQIIVTLSGKTILASQLLKQMYFLAWNGSEWSNIQPQARLTTFAAPETLSVVHLSCIQLAPGGDDQILAIGCDTGNTGDIYVTSRSIGPVEGWFNNLTNWSEPQSITNGNEIQLMSHLLSAPNGFVYFLWTQSAEANSDQRRSIFYSGWDGEQWTTPTALFPALEQKAGRPAATLFGDRLLVTWVDTNNGGLFFSSADSRLAADPNQWQQPQAIGGIRAAGPSPDIAVDSNGVISITYTLPINENRGIYVVQSKDGGATWSDPIRLFDAAQQGWDMVDQPHVLVTNDGTVHELWSRASTTSSATSGGLYTSASMDGGQTWSAPEELFKGAIQSSGLASQGNQIYAYWSSQQQDQTLFSQRVSADGGRTWSTQVDFSRPLEAGTAYSFGYGNNEINIYQIVLSGQRGAKVNQWQWDGAQWTNVGFADLAIDPQANQNTSTEQPRTIMRAEDLLVSRTGNGNTALVYIAAPDDLAQSTGHPQVYFAYQKAGNPSGNQENPTPTAVFTPTPAETQTIAPTTTRNAPMIGNVAIPSVVPGSVPVTGLQTQNNWIGLAIGMGLSMAFIIALAIFGRRVKDQRKYRKHKTG